MSFRDPAGRLVDVDGRLLRFVRQSATPDFLTFLDSPLAKQLEHDGRVVKTRRLSDEQLLTRAPGSENGGPRKEAWGAVVEHDRVPFVSYPYEWAPEMLHAAGELTLDLAEAALETGWELKDATPFNVLFEGTSPVFVDLLSFQPRNPRSPIWLPYAQFVRTFLLPLLANKHFGLPLRRTFQCSREGLEPEELYRLCSLRQRLLSPFLALSTIPTLLAREGTRAAGRTAIPQHEPERARFTLRSILRHLRRALTSARPVSSRASIWTSYTTCGPHDVSYHAEKHRVIERIVREERPSVVLDIGCNDGHVSRVAAEAGASVVAIDQDESVVGAAWAQARQKDLRVLPLVVDVANPPGPTGWRNRECPSFLERVKGRFDAVFLLAIVHHLMVTAGIPLEEIMTLAAELTRDLAVIEYVPATDPMFRRIARGREGLYNWLTVAAFTEACRREFRIEAIVSLDAQDRQLYVLRKL